MEEKFQDEQLNEKILGPVSDEELEISQLIESMRVILWLLAASISF